MDRIDTAIARRHLAQFDHLFGGVEGVRHIDQPGGQAEGTLLHRLGDELLHLVHFGGCGGTVLISHDGSSHLPRADIGHDIGTDAFLSQEMEEAAQCGPGAVHRRHHHHGIIHRRAQHWSRRQMLAQDFGGNALGDFAQAAAVEGQAELRMGMHVEEARRNDHACGIYDLARFDRRAPDIDDGVALDRHIALEPGSAGAIHDLAILDQDIGLSGWRALRKACQREPGPQGDRRRPEKQRAFAPPGHRLNLTPARNVRPSESYRLRLVCEMLGTPVPGARIGGSLSSRFLTEAKNSTDPSS